MKCLLVALLGIHRDAHGMKVLCPSRHAPIEWLQATHYLRILKGVKVPAEIVKLANMSFRSALFQDDSRLYLHILALFEALQGQEFQIRPSTKH